MDKTIVIVDDFKNTLWVIDFTLSSLKVNTLKANNGQEALAFFDGRTIDLLITDYNMPIMNGLELIKAVKKLPKYEFIPIIMLTTEQDAEKKQKVDEIKNYCVGAKTIQTRCISENCIKVLKTIISFTNG